LIFAKIERSEQKLLFILDNVENFDYVEAYIKMKPKNVVLILISRHENLTKDEKIVIILVDSFSQLEG
jgi:hypothetical protein